MQLVVNQLIESIVDESRVIERILWIDVESICVICVNNNDGPYFRNISEVEDAIKNESVKIMSEDSFITIVNEDDIKDKHREIRDKSWSMIKELASQEPDVFISRYREKAIRDLSTRFGVSKSTINRYLKKYWKRGKAPNALLPDFINCGGKNISKKVGITKMGRPRKHQEISGLGVNTSDDIKKIFRKAINRFYYTTSKKSLVLTYELMRKEYFSEGFKVENGVKIPIIKPQSEVPSFGQFRYFYEKELDLKRLITSRYSNKKFQKQFRAITGSAMQGVYQPGTYEIDCQTADVFLVSRFNRNWVIGRPALYVCIDRFSRLVTGVYVTFENNSYTSAAMCLLNAASEKVSFCKKYDIEIDESMWPVKHLPDCILADRGELEGKGIENIINLLNITVLNAPPYRADFKSSVERFFGLNNDRVKPFTPGTIDLDGKERGDKDYRLKSKLDLFQFTKIIIKCILFHNNHYVLNNYNREELMISDEVTCIPINLWNWGIANKGGTLRSLPEETVKLALMPTGQGTVTEKGIKFNGMYYASKSMLKEQIFVKARMRGTWKVKTCYDPRDLNYIYVMGDKQSEYEKCFLIDYQERYKDKCFEEVNYLFQIEKMKKESMMDTVAQAKTQLISEIESIVKKAEDDYKRETNIPESDRQRVKNIRDNRKIEKTINRTEEMFELSVNDAIEDNMKAIEIKDDKVSEEVDGFDMLMLYQKEGLNKVYGKDSDS